MSRIRAARAWLREPLGQMVLDLLFGVPVTGGVIWLFWKFFHQ